MQSSSQIIITDKSTSSFLQAGCPSRHPANSVKALKGKIQLTFTGNTGENAAKSDQTLFTSYWSGCYTLHYHLSPGCECRHVNETKSVKAMKGKVKITSTTNKPSHFLQAGCPSCQPTNSIEAIKAMDQIRNQKGTQ